MSLAKTHDKRTSGARLRGGGRRPCTKDRSSDARTRPDPRFLRYLGEHRALPVDLAAALLRCSERQVLQMIEIGSELSWIRSFEYLGEPCPWASLEGGGWAQAGRPGRRSWRPSPMSLSHRREVIEARLILRDEKPGWAWLSESDVGGQNTSGAINPDGVLKRGDLRWAIEVERSKKPVGTLRAKLERLCRQYTKVIYFAAPSIRVTLAKLQEAGELENLELRPLPGEPSHSAPTKLVRRHYEPSEPAREMLTRINEEGVVARSQLPRFLDWDEGDVEEALQELNDNQCLRQGQEHNGDGGWIWCRRRGVNRSGSDLAPPPPPDSGGLMRRFVLMEIRLQLLAEFPGSTWVTRRRLRHGYKGNRSGLPDGVLVRGGYRYAVVLLETRRDRRSAAHMFTRLKGEYADVLCYRTRNLSNWITGLVSAYEFDWLDVRDLPTPPDGSPYPILEDESPAASREGQLRVVRQVLEASPSFDPTEEDRTLLRLATSEPCVSRLQIPRALGRAGPDVEASVDRLKKHGFLVEEDGWLRSTKRGADASGLELGVARARREEPYLDEWFHVMEVRLSLDQPASLECWKTRRQLSVEAGAEPGAINGFPHGAALIGGEWHAIGLFLSENRRRGVAERLSRWREHFPRVRCYCMESDVEAFERFIVRWGLSEVEVLAIPMSPDPAARKRQAASLASLLAQRERRAAEGAPKVAARRTVCSAVRDGQLEKPDTCEACTKRVGESNVEALYTDYSRPLDVEWLCRKCHRAKERAIRQADASRED